MCGRFTLTSEIEEVAHRFNAFPPDFSYSPRYNIAPSQLIPVVMKDQHDQNQIRLMKWGLIPFWAKDASIGNRLINARIETLTEKPAFRKAIRQNRCLIPADGFYEWLKLDQGKQPMRIRLKNRKLFAMAGIFDTWDDPKGKRIISCSIITTEASDSIRHIHIRMPLILSPNQEVGWLSPNLNGKDQINQFLSAITPPDLEAYPVTTAVNSPRYDNPELIKPA
ncbi:SOS response-associated peptidase [Natronospira sp.]|uniref:SOS response-associated peptidase n=1 Tax=Natronospira sp. TaxID=2024970 RepID=UPI003872CB58